MSVKLQLLSAGAVFFLGSQIVLSQQSKLDTVPKEKQIEEVLITGALGIKKKNDAFTGNNAVVKTEELMKAGNPNAVQALTGKVSGLQINLPNSSVNSQATINLRGQRSITGDNGALVVIDGAPSTAAIFQQLPPEVIESVNVFKGQQGAALYGERGSNGVIIVTTKKGTNTEKINFTLSSNIDFSWAYKLPIVQKKYGQGWPGDATFDSADYNGTNWVPYENGSWGPAYDHPSFVNREVIVGLPQADGTFIKRSFTPIDNHFKNFFKTGVMFQNGLSMNVGGKDSYAFLSINRVQNDFVVDRDQLKRNNILFKGGKQLGKFRIDGTFSLIDQHTSETDSNLYDQLLQTPANVDVRSYSNSGLEGAWSAYIDNPYWTIQNVRYDNKLTTFNGILKAEYEFNNNINISYLANILTTSTVGESHNNGYKFLTTWEGTGTILDGQNPSDFGHTPPISSYYKSIGKRFNYYGDLMLNFNYDLTDDLNMKLNVGNNLTDYSLTTTTVGGTNLQIPGFYHINNVLSPDPISNLLNTQVRTRTIAGFANLDLSFRDYLFLNSTFRYEKSSVTSTRATGTEEFSNKAQPYYSVGLSFIPTKAFESLQGGIMNYAKLSASYTRVGNTSAIPAYATDEITGILPTGFPFNIASYVINRNPTDPNINPEFSSTKEAALQLGFFRDRITFGAAVFKTDVSDLITNATTSNTSGISTLRANIGDMVNKGFELDLGLTPFKSKDFEWNVSGSYSTYKSEVTALSGGIEEVNMLSYSTPAVGIFAKVGEQFPLIKGTKYQRDDQGRIIVGANGTPLTTPGFEILGKVTPDYILGFSSSIRYKGITLSGTADYRTGNSFVAFSKRELAFTGALEESADFDRSKGYVIPNSVQFVNGQYVTNSTPVGGVADYLHVNDFFTGTYRSIGENFVVDGTAFRIREIALSYTLPKSILRNTFVNTMTFGVYARNPFVWYAKSNRNFADPETASNTGTIDRTPGQALGVGGPNAYGIAFAGQYPTTRTFGFSFNATF